MNLTIRNLPEDLVNKLRLRAKKFRRSLNSEILHRLELSMKQLSTSTPESIKEQRANIAQILGTWEDDRPTSEIIEDIYESRTLGRKIDL
jgi:hypothetical protein